MLKFFSLYLLLIIPLGSYSQNEWMLKKDENNIKIYTRSTPDTHFDEYKAVTKIETSLNSVLGELLQAPQYTENCIPGISYYVKSHNSNQHVFYAHKSLPWPIRDRDIVTLLTINKISDVKIKLTLESLPDAIPEKEKTIRIKKLMGHWLLEEKGKSIQVTQQLVLDP